MTSLNVANNAATNPMDRSGRTDDVSGVVALANAIPDMGAFTSLDISNQVDEDGEGGLGAEGAKCLAEALKDHP